MSNKTITLVTGIEQNDAGEQELVTVDYSYPIFVKGSLVKKAIDLGVQLEKNGDVNSSVIDKLASYAVELYGKQFTKDELIDGTDASELLDTLTGVLGLVMGVEDEGNETKKFIETKKL